ncbi:polyprenol monophosphomannose synthase [Bifidobacterium moukalabense]|uniref:polyprenol monophosphomannose synthase n=1 Tax=Bifidobacterium moukalabense TaxID=1333651 RepID=UPI0010F931C0|nr:polyprenol monophosphomannose synthase [Bifidobacterium moukalabense]
MTERTCVVMPTYNELENLRPTIGGIFACRPSVEILIVDDGSPDGTGELADRMAIEDPRIHVLHRAGKNGLGPAYLAGFAWALNQGFDVICEMDMDGSHRPQDLPKLLDALAGGTSGAVPDLVIGSRRVDGGRTEGWSAFRDLISRGGSWYARTMLGIDVRDMTAGFRTYRASMLRALDLDAIEANGYVFQIDMTRRVAAAGGRIVEVPIVFPDRVRGKSKMSNAIVVEAMRRVTVWGLQRLLRK